MTENEILIWNKYTKNTKNYNLRSQADLKVPSVNSTFKELNSLIYYGAVIYGTPYQLIWKILSSYQNLQLASENENKINAHAEFVKHMYMVLDFCYVCKFPV